MKTRTRSIVKIFNIALMTGFIAFTVSRHMNRPAEDCAALADTIALSEKLPGAAQDLAALSALSALPVTGAPIRDLQGTKLRVCRVAEIKGGRAAGAYSPNGRTMLVVQDISNPHVLSHELFHAGQDRLGALSALVNPALTAQDQIAANLLIEAVAVGYTHMVFKEMDSRRPGAYAAFAASDYSFAMDAAFTQTYDNARAGGGDEKESLRAGGTAVVAALLDGGNKHWTLGYVMQSAENYFSAKGPAAPLSRRADPDYQQKMSDYFNNAAAVGNGINILPEPLRGTTPQAVTTVLKRAGLNLPSA